MSANKERNVIILTAGDGKRMLSGIPKVMHQIGGKSMLQHLIDSVTQINVASIYIVYNCKNEIIMKEVNCNDQTVPIYWIPQQNPNGTGHAVQQVLSIIKDDAEILVLCGDVPLVSCETLRQLCVVKLKCDIGLVTASVVNTTGYGRVMRNQSGDVIDIVEYEDSVNNSPEDVVEVNSGIFLSMARYVKCWLKELKYHDIKNELYLTGIISIAHQMGYRINTIQPVDIIEILGVNSAADLTYLERKYQIKQAQRLLSLGVFVSDPNRFDLRGELICGRDVFIDINVIIEGSVILGNRVRIGSGCILKNTVIADDVIIYPFSVIEESKISLNSKVGPFARLRPGVNLDENTRVGNFVELKSTRLGKRSKVGHLSYLGNSSIGDQVNIGAGTITCNYDGVKKHNTIIGDNVSIGADSQLVAPVVIGNDAIVGAGTTVTQDISVGQTIISRIRQFSIVHTKNQEEKK